ncbi:hypothetical protein ABZ413_33410 [Nocardia rhamnosiphila]|uniref:hypothetical protein n=1 Tax=Nocardia rhamnosiphila TaxID=426716 RepID=UPI0033D176E8
MDTDISCPHCSTLDLVQSVPALHADGVSTSHSSNNYNAVGLTSHGFVPVIGTSETERTHTSAAVRSLPLGPPEQPIARLVRWGLLLSIPALLALITAGVYISSLSGSQAWSTAIAAVILVGFFFVPGSIPLVLAALRARDNTRIRRGRPAAWMVWSSAWYCHRCGLAYWPVSPTPAVPARRGFLPQQFQWFVWNAGRYVRA